MLDGIELNWGSGEGEIWLMGVSLGTAFTSHFAIQQNP